MTRKSLTVSAALVFAASALLPVIARANELRFVLTREVDLYHTYTATFDLPSSPLPVSTFSVCCGTGAEFLLSNYTGTGSLSSGTDLVLEHVDYFGADYYNWGLGHGSGSEGGLAGYNGVTPFWTGSIDAPTFAPTPTEDIGGYSTLTITDAVPEPAAWALMLIGFGGLGGALRTARRRPGAVIG